MSLEVCELLHHVSFLEHIQMLNVTAHNTVLLCCHKLMMHKKIMKAELLCRRLMTSLQHY